MITKKSYSVPQTAIMTGSQFVHSLSITVEHDDTGIDDQYQCKQIGIDKRPVVSVTSHFSTPLDCDADAMLNFHKSRDRRSKMMDADCDKNFGKLWYVPALREAVRNHYQKWAAAVAHPGCDICYQSILPQKGKCYNPARGYAHGTEATRCRDCGFRFNICYQCRNAFRHNSPLQLKPFICPPTVGCGKFRNSMFHFQSSWYDNQNCQLDLTDGARYSVDSKLGPIDQLSTYKGPLCTFIFSEKEGQAGHFHFFSTDVKLSKLVLKRAQLDNKDGFTDHPVNQTNHHNWLHRLAFYRCYGLPISWLT